MEHVATAARAQTAATGAQLQRMTLRAVTVATTTAPSSSSSMAEPSISSANNNMSGDSPYATLTTQPTATATTTRSMTIPTTTTTAAATALDIRSSPPQDGELQEDEPRREVGQKESHRPRDDVAVDDDVDFVNDDDNDVDDVELTRGSSGSNTPTAGSRTRQTSDKSSPSSCLNAGELRGSHQQECVNNDSSHSNSNNTSDLLLGLSEDDSLYFTED